MRGKLSRCSFGMAASPWEAAQQGPENTRAGLFKRGVELAFRHALIVLDDGKVDDDGPAGEVGAGDDFRNAGDENGLDDGQDDFVAVGVKLALRIAGARGDGAQRVRQPFCDIRQIVVNEAGRIAAA